METLVFPESTSASSSSSFNDENLGTTTCFTELLLRSDDLFHTKTKIPIITANDVVAITSIESDTDSPSEIPSTDSRVRTNSEFEPILISNLARFSFLFKFILRAPKIELHSVYERLRL
jgi:hypothetical protein